MKPALALRVFLATGLCLLLLACAQPVPADQASFVGHWRGEGMLLVIGADGNAMYQRVRGSQRSSINGPAHGFSREGFRIGIGPLSAAFKVQQPPALRDGRWRMTVDGVELTRLDIARADPGKPSLRL